MATPMHKSSHEGLIHLQRSAGNQAVSRLLSIDRQVSPSLDDRDLRGETDADETDDRPTPIQRKGGAKESAASATGVALGASGPIHTDTKYGLRTPIQVRGTDLANVLDSELVGSSIDHTGSMEHKPSARSNNSGFMAADDIPDDRHSSGIADHLRYFDRGGDGSYSRLQMDLYKIPTQGIDDPVAMPESGYRIKREVKAEGSDVVGIVTKTAEAVTIGEKTSTPGLTAQKQAKVTLRADKNDADE